MPDIHTLHATLTEDAARRMLSPHGLKGLLTRWSRGDLRALASVYIPFRLYTVSLDDRGAKASRYYAVDSASGLLDPYEFSAVPDLELTDTRNAIAATIPEDATRARAIEKLRRKLYSAGFFRLRNPSLTAELKLELFHVPYWAGFYGDDQQLNITVLDAVRHSIEGAKVRRVIHDWLLQQPRADGIVPR